MKFGRPGRVANKRFKYIPRYYDEDRIEFEQNVERARRERDRMEQHEPLAHGGHEERMRKAMEFRTRAFNTEKNSMNKYASVRTIIIAGILFFIFYLIFSSDIILRIFDAFNYE